MNVAIAESWKTHLQEEFQKPYFANLINFVKQEYSTQKIYPQGKLIFNAFDKCSFDDLKVVILGQDPYHGQSSGGIGQANGLSFSVNDGVASPPSLQNIFKEMQDDLKIAIPKNGNLERWAEQGVLLLNATLTVRAGQAGSHQNKGWEIFTDAIIKEISDKKSGIVFLLWGKYAQNKGSKIDVSKHLLLKAAHPSPMAANFGGWFGNKHFSQANTYLKNNGKEPINW